MSRVESPVRNVPRLSASLLAAFLISLLGLTACGIVGGGESTSSPTPDSEEAQAAEDPAIEMEYWQSVKDSGDADQLLAYIKTYPQGRFVELAESRLKNLTAPGDPLDDPNVAGPGASNVDPPAAAPSAAPPPPTTLSRSRTQSDRDLVLQVVQRSLGRYGDPRLHIYPDIPRQKADNAATVHGIDPHSILVLYDDGLRGKGKTGWVLTDRRVYWRFVSGDDPYFLDFRDIDSAIARKNKFLLNGYDVPTTMSDDSRYAAQKHADLMMDLRSAFR